ncbi:MAG: hypothetical protein M1140_07530 [Chloroflexi bacterium]|nr:hypothetical protein [Chloroflexota bacterium]
MKKLAELVIGACVALMGALAALYGGLYALFDGMSLGRIVGVIELGIVALITGALLCLWILDRVRDARRRADPFEGMRSGPMVDAVWCRSPPELAAYQPPASQLPAPRVITVPRYSVLGQATPYGAAPAQPIHLQTVTEEGESLTVPLPALMRFLGLATPARSEWTGNRVLYGECLQFCELHGLVHRRANGGVAWRGDYPLEARKRWALQFEDRGPPGGTP